MNVMDFITKYIDEQGMSQTQAAAVAGMSRQNLWDKLNNRNPRFRTVEKILTAFGFEISIQKNGEVVKGIEERRFFETARRENPIFGKMEAILNSLGYKLLIVKKTEK